MKCGICKDNLFISGQLNYIHWARCFGCKYDWVPNNSAIFFGNGELYAASELDVLLTETYELAMKFWKLKSLW